MISMMKSIAPKGTSSRPCWRRRWCPFTSLAMRSPAASPSPTTCRSRRALHARLTRLAAPFAGPDRGAQPHRNNGERAITVQNFRCRMAAGAIVSHVIATHGHDRNGDNVADTAMGAGLVSPREACAGERMAEPTRRRRMSDDHTRNMGAMQASPAVAPGNASGTACRAPAVRGKTRCRMHGSAAEIRRAEGKSECADAWAIHARPDRRKKGDSGAAERDMGTAARTQFR